MIPSWSWSSILGEITFPELTSPQTLPRKEPLPPGQFATIDDASIEITGANSFGRVSEAALRIIGLLQKAFLVTWNTINPNRYRLFLAHQDKQQRIGVGFTPDALIADSECDRCYIDELWKPVAERQPVRKGYYGDDVLREPVWGLGICGSFGLVLRESKSSPGSFTRIGLCDDVQPFLKDAPREQVVII